MRSVNVEIWSGLTRKVGFCNAYQALTVTDSFNKISPIALTLAHGNAKAALLAQPGARLRIDCGDMVWTGPVRRISGHVPGNVTFHAEDDLRLLWRILAWPKPANDLAHQDIEYAHKSGPAETVLKAFVSENVARLRLPVDVAPSKGRGATIAVDMRMHQLSERLLPAVENAGLGVSVVAQGGRYLVDVYETRATSKPLTFESGVLQSLEYEWAHPTATRVVGGGQGEGTARLFRQQIAADREGVDLIEKFIDARDCDSTDKLDAKIAAELADGDMTAGIRIALSGTAHYRYGPAGFYKGDTVPISTLGQTVTDRIRSAAITWDKDGENVTPVIGDHTDDPNAALVNRLRALTRTVGDLIRR